MLAKLSPLKMPSFILFVINILILIIFHLFSVFEFYPKDDWYVLVFLFQVCSILCLFVLEKIKLTSLMFIFNITLFVFLGGRFFTYYFGIHEGSLFNLQYMTAYEPPDHDELYIFNLVSTFIVVTNISYLLFVPDDDKKVIFFGQNNCLYRPLIYPILVILLILFGINFAKEWSLLKLVGEEGYLARYSAQGKMVESGSGFLSTMLFVFIGLILSFRDNFISKVIFILLAIYSLIILLSGQRELFVTTFLFGIWFYGLKNDISIYKILLFFVLIAFALLFMMSFSHRVIDNNTEYTEKLIFLLYSQGVSLGVLSYGINEISHFPILSYITSFFPGSFRVFTMFHPDLMVYPQETGFGAYTAYTANANLYKQGYGLGWSIVGNLILFAHNIKVIFILFCIIWGIFLKKLDVLCYRSNYYLGLSAALATKIFFVARAEIKTVFHTMFLYCLVYFLLLFLNRLLAEYKEKVS